MLSAAHFPFVMLSAAKHLHRTGFLAIARNDIACHAERSTFPFCHAERSEASMRWIPRWRSE